MEREYLIDRTELPYDAFVADPRALGPVRLCEWWERPMKDVAAQQKTWCTQNGWSCATCPYNVD